ncbi:MAG: hypothetical protein H0U76_26200 [Ktedonobacteraceae bacterium]|nr:hypothetical protein [Ktedonobacteraceae bacterium]
MSLTEEFLTTKGEGGIQVWDIKNITKPSHEWRIDLSELSSPVIISNDTTLVITARAKSVTRKDKNNKTAQWDQLVQRAIYIGDDIQNEGEVVADYQDDNHVHYFIYNEDQLLVITADGNGTVILWKYNKPQLLIEDYNWHLWDIHRNEDHQNHEDYDNNHDLDTPSTFVLAVTDKKGSKILIANQGQTAQLWDTDTGELIRILTSHRSEISSAVFSWDGKWILTGNKKGIAQLWDADSGREQAILLGHNDEILSMAFSPDSHWVVTGSADGTARQYDISSLTLADAELVGG